MINIAMLTKRVAPVSECIFLCLSAIRIERLGWHCADHNASALPHGCLCIVLSLDKADKFFWRIDS
jgi:hypothetical protein